MENEIIELTTAQETILKIKELKKGLNLSVKQIEAMSDTNGHHISEPTLYRVFAKDSEIKDSFNYTTTLEPLANMLLNYKALYTQDETATAKYELYEVMLRHKNEVIETQNQQLEAEKQRIEALRNEHDARCRECEDRMSFLMHQIELKDKRMERKDAIIDKLLPYALQGKEQK